MIEMQFLSATPTTIGMGGSYVNEYLYDSFNRLSEAKGTFGGTQTYQVAMDYNEAGGITNKHQTVAGGFANTFAYNNAYTYDPQKPHQLVGLTNAAVGSGQPLETGFAWNASGSMRAVAVRPTENDSHDTIERYVYNEEQWMMGHVNEQTDQYTHFVYDTKGERILKGSINTASLSTNGQSPALSLTMDPYTLYLNPFYVAVQRNQMDQVSKHYYYNGQRFATKTGFYLAPLSPPTGMSSMGNTTLAKNLEATITELGFTDSLSWSTQSSSAPDTNVAHYPRLMYYYHPDYLGHVEYITDLDGLPYQHFYYTAWGETLLDQKATRPGMNFDSPYRFNGKELDDETGLYYYGARYYNPTVSVWLGVDPLASQFPHQSPYAFTDNNPIMLWDPTGKSAEEADGGGWTQPVVTSYTGSRVYNPETRTTTYSTSKILHSELKKVNSDGLETWSASLIKTESSSVTINSNGEVIDVLNSTTYSGWDANGNLNFGKSGSSENRDYEKTTDFIKAQITREKNSVLTTGMVEVEYLADYGNRLRKNDENALPFLAANNLLSPGNTITTAFGLAFDFVGPTPATIMGPAPNPTEYNWFRRPIEISK